MRLAHSMFWMILLLNSWFPIFGIGVQDVNLRLDEIVRLTNLKNHFLDTVVQPLPEPKGYGKLQLLGEDVVNGSLASYKIGQPWPSKLSTYSFKRKDVDWYVNGVKILGHKSKICGIVVYYKDSPEEDYLIYVWERLKEKFGEGSRIEYKGFEIDMWVTDRYLIGMGFYNEPKYFLFVVDKNRIKDFQGNVKAIE